MLRFLLLGLCAVLWADTVSAFDRTPWQNVRLAEAAEGTRLSIGEAPAGLFLRRQLDPEKRYRLSVRGSGRPITMRLKIDGGPHEYLPAPMPQIKRTIAGASSIELLFYSDTPAEYLLSHAEIEECSDCRTQQDLIRRIEAEIPGLDRLAGMAKAVALLKWAANVSNYTPSAKLIPSDFEGWSPERMTYEFFDGAKGGVSCGGHSVFLLKILHLFGIEAFTVNYGVPGTYVTHVTVMISTDKQYYVLDPSFGVLFKRRGRDLDVEQALALIKANETAEIGTISVGIERKGIITRPGYLHPALDRICVHRIATGNGLRKCTIGRNSLLNVFRRGANARAWAEEGVPMADDALLRLMVKGVFSVGPSRDPAVREAFIAMLKRQGITFHPN